MWKHQTLVVGAGEDEEEDEGFGEDERRKLDSLKAVDGVGRFGDVPVLTVMLR